jgi:hypothetical protein
MSARVESQFEEYCDAIVAVLSHADRHEPAKLYLKGLLLPGERKSVEPMAARLCPENERSAHRSMNHLVAAADWDDWAVLGVVAKQLAPALVKKDERCWWILDDTSHVKKKGQRSVVRSAAVLRALGQDGELSGGGESAARQLVRQCAAGLSDVLARGTDRGPRTVRKAGVPEGIEFRTKGQIARGD